MTTRGHESSRKGCGREPLLAVVAVTALGAGIYLPLSNKISRTWASYYRQEDFCVARNAVTTDAQRITSAIEHMRKPEFRERVLTSSEGAIDTFAPINPKNCCHIEFRGLHGEYAVNFWGVWRNEATAAVYFDSLPFHPITKRHPHVLTDACGDVYQWGD